MFVLKRLQEGYPAKGKRLYMCFVDLDKNFDSVSRSVGMDNEKERKYQKFWLDQ